MLNTFSLAIVGYRNFYDYERFSEVVSGYIQMLRIQEHGHVHISKIVSGGCRGTDEMAQRYAKEHDIVLEVYHADWDKHGRAAGPIRNKKIVDNSDIVIAFLHDESKGTRHTIDYARSKKKKVVEIKVG